MDKNTAIIKINKLLALANNKAAAPGEKENALEMATKIASKFGLKIVKGNCNASPAENKIFNYEFYVKCFDKNFLDLLFKLLGARRWQFVGGNRVSVTFINMEFNQEAFAKFYKKFVSVYYKNLKNAKETYWDWDRTCTKNYREGFFYNFENGFNNHNDMHKTYDFALGIMFNEYAKRYIVKEVAR